MIKFGWQIFGTCDVFICNYTLYYFIIYLCMYTCIYIYIWGFPKMVVPNNHGFPTMGVPPFKEIPIFIYIYICISTHVASYSIHLSICIDMLVFVYQIFLH